MRKFLEKYYNDSELIINTGHSYQFVTNLEKYKYKEMYLPMDYINDSFRVNTIMIEQEVDEIVKRFEEEGKPFILGEIVGNHIDCYSNGLTELDIVEMVHNYHEICKEKMVNNIGTTIEKECKEWNMLTNRQKQMITDLIIELANK